jgi:hypothetical protein
VGNGAASSRRGEERKGLEKYRVEWLHLHLQPPAMAMTERTTGRWALRWRRRVAL